MEPFLRGGMCSNFNAQRIKPVGWGFLISLVYVGVALQLGILIDGQSRNSKRVKKKTS